MYSLIHVGLILLVFTVGPISSANAGTGADTIWNQLNQLASPGAEGQGLSEKSGPEPFGKTWIDGEALKYMLGPSTARYGQMFDPVFQNLVGVELVQGDNLLQIHGYLLKAVDVQIKGPPGSKNLKATKAFQLLGLHFSAETRLQISHEGSVIRISTIDTGNRNSFYLDVAVPVVSGRIYVRTISFDVESGQVSVEAGVLGNFVTLIAQAQVFSSPIKAQVDIWKTIEANIADFNFGPMIFQQF